MKRTYLILVLLAFVVIISGCAQLQEPKASPGQEPEVFQEPPPIVSLYEGQPAKLLGHPIKVISASKSSSGEMKATIEIDGKATAITRSSGAQPDNNEFSVSISSVDDAAYGAYGYTAQGEYDIITVYSKYKVGLLLQAGDKLAANPKVACTLSAPYFCASVSEKRKSSVVSAKARVFDTFGNQIGSDLDLGTVDPLLVSLELVAGDSKILLSTGSGVYLLDAQGKSSQVPDSSFFLYYGNRPSEFVYHKTAKKFVGAHKTSPKSILVFTITESGSVGTGENVEANGVDLNYYNNYKNYISSANVGATPENFCFSGGDQSISDKSKYFSDKFAYNEKDNSALTVSHFTDPLGSKSNRLRKFSGSVCQLGSPSATMDITGTLSSIARDTINNRYLISYVNGGSGYLQLLDSNLNKIGSEISLGSVVDSPSVAFDPATSKFVVAYADQNGLQIRHSDPDKPDEVTLTSAQEIKMAEDQLTAQFSIFDKTNRLHLTQGQKRSLKVSANFDHPTLGRRLKGTLDFTQGPVNLNALVIEANDKITVVKSTFVTGLSDKILLIQNKNNGKGVLVCPTATRTDLVVPGCIGELQFKDVNPDTPQTKGSVTVKLASQTDPNFAYWSLDSIADGKVTDLKALVPGTVNGPTATKGRFGPDSKALKFDGTDDFIQIDDPKEQTILDRTNAITVSAWILQNSKARNSNQAIIRKVPTLGSADPYYLFGLMFDQKNEKICFGLSKDVPGTNKEVCSTTVIPAFSPGTEPWTLVTGVWDSGSKMRIYVNGNKEAEVDFEGPIGANNKPILIGKTQFAGTEFDGTIDEPFVFGRALTDQEAKKLYEDHQAQINAIKSEVAQKESELYYEVSGLSGSGIALQESPTTTPTSTATPTPTPTPTPTLKASTLTPKATTWSSTSKEVTVTASYKSTVATTPSPQTVIFTNEILHPSYTFKDSSGNLAPNTAGVQELKVKKGDTVTIRSSIVSTEAAHKHGIKIGAPYNIDQQITSSSASSPTEITFTAGTTGSFDITCGTCSSGSSGDHPFMKAKLIVEEPQASNILTGATCKVKYSDEFPDELLLERPMAFDSGSGEYKHLRTFSETPAGDKAKVKITCSQSSYEGKVVELNLASQVATTPTPTPTATPSSSPVTSSSPGASASPTPTPSPAKQQSSMTLSSTTWTDTAKIVSVKAVYKSGSVVITGAACKSKFSDGVGENDMGLVSGEYLYRSEYLQAPVNVKVDVTCSHSQYDTKTATVNLETGVVTTPTPTPTSTPGASPTGTPAAATAQGVQKMRLVSPKDNTVAGTRVTFTCTAEGEGLKEIALYTDISGSWKKDEKKLVTDSPATVQFRKENVPAGKYTWNCEATTSTGSVFLADDDRTFEVKLATSPVPDVVCSQTDDCGSWAPTTCPESGLQTRTCSKSEDCGYSLSRNCVYVGGPGTTPGASPESQQTTPSKGRAPAKDDPTPIIIGIVIAIGAGGAVIFVVKRKGSGGGEGGLWKGKE